MSHDADIHISSMENHKPVQTLKNEKNFIGLHRRYFPLLDISDMQPSYLAWKEVKWCIYFICLCKSLDFVFSLIIQFSCELSYAFALKQPDGHFSCMQSKFPQEHQAHRCSTMSVLK